MIKKITLLCTLLVCLAKVQAQKKNDLLIEIENLKAQISETENELAISRKNEIVSKTEAASYKTQSDELLESNASLMQNLNNFTKASIEKSDNIGKTLESLQAKEAQLKIITDQFSSHDSIAFLVLTDFKKVLGENSNITVANGAVIVVLNEGARKGLTSKVASEKATTDGILAQIATVLKSQKESSIVVEAGTNTGEFDVALTQATLVANKFLKQHSINPNRIAATAKDGGFSEGLSIKVYPKFDAFYFALREQLKASNK